MTARVQKPFWGVMAALALALLMVAGLDSGGAETQTERIQRLNESYACPVCDGESVADSSAAVAASIRTFIFEQVTSGASDTEIRDQLVRSYGLEILLNPPSEGMAALVWILPVAVIAAGAGILALYLLPARGGKLIVIGGLASLAMVAGWALIAFSGERGVNDQLTGEIDASPRAQVLDCQQMGSSGGDLLGALECLDDVLVTNPVNVEALTYRGWFLMLAVSSMGDVPEAVTAATEAVALLDQAIEIDPSYPDPYVFRAIAMDRQGDSDAVCANLSVLGELNPPEFFLTQTARLNQVHQCG